MVRTRESHWKVRGRTSPMLRHHSSAMSFFVSNLLLLYEVDFAVLG